MWAHSTPWNVTNVSMSVIEGPISFVDHPYASTIIADIITGGQYGFRTCIMWAHSTLLNVTDVLVIEAPIRSAMETSLLTAYQRRE